MIGEADSGTDRWRGPRLPAIRGLRIPVATLVSMKADGLTAAEILGAYPDLVPEDLREALQFAAETVRERELPLLTAP